jgi:hypothetical protein
MRLVAMLTANGVSHRVIAAILECDEKTLRKHFPRELAEGKADIVARVGAEVVRQALKGNIRAARYWLSTHGGPEWQERRVLAGDPSQPIAIRDVTAMSDAEIEEELAELEQQEATALMARKTARGLPVN